MIRPLPPIVFENEGSWAYGTGTKEIVLPPGDWYLDDTICAVARMGVTIRGPAPRQTHLIWRGAEKPLFAFAACRDATLRDITLSFETPALCAAVLTNRGTGGPYFSTKNTLERVFINGSRANGKLKYGVVVDGYAYGGNGHNTDFHKILNCSITGATRAGIAVMSSQAHRGVIEGNEVSECGIAHMLVQASQTVQNNTGSDNNLVLYAGQLHGGSLVYKQNTDEHSLRGLHIAPSSGNEFYVIEDNRFHGMYPQPILTDDFAETSNLMAGRIRMRGNTFHSNGPYPPSFIFAQRVDNSEVTDNVLSVNEPPFCRRLHQLDSKFPVWRNVWQGLDGSPVNLPAPDSAIRLQPANSPWPQARPRPDVSAWVKEWRDLTQTAPLPGVANARPN